MEFNYAFVFAISSKVVWSAENEKTLLEDRFTAGTDRDKVLDFIETDKVGEFIVLDAGLLFKTS